MRQIPKTELSPDNGCVIDTKWKLGNLSYHPSAAGKESTPLVTENIRLPELVVYDHIGFKGAYARTNLSFHYIGDFWNDRISSLIIVSLSGHRADVAESSVAAVYDRRINLETR